MVCLITKNYMQTEVTKAFNLAIFKVAIALLKTEDTKLRCQNRKYQIVALATILPIML